MQLTIVHDIGDEVVAGARMRVLHFRVFGQKLAKVNIAYLSGREKETHSYLLKII